MENIKVILWGLDDVGCGIAKMIDKKKGIEVSDVIETEKVGSDLGKIIGKGNSGIIVSSHEYDVLSKIDGDIVIVSNYLKYENLFNRINKIIKNKKNCIVIGEKFINQDLNSQKQIKEIDALAKENGVSILGIDINSGFLLDTLIIALSAACGSVKEITASRVNDISTLGESYIKKQGVGNTIEDFEKGVSDGTIVGHIGFSQTIRFITETLGIEIDGIEETIDPVISNTYREGLCAVVNPGMTAGSNHTVCGLKNGKRIITLEHIQQIHPQSEGFKIGDSVDIKTDRDIHIRTEVDISSEIETVSMSVNMIPQVIGAPAGLKTIRDIPIPHTIENNFADQVEYYKSY